MPVGRIVETENFVRIPMREKEDFIAGSFRTQDIGREGYSKRLAGKLRKSGKWATKTWLISKKEPSERARELFSQIRYEFKRQGIPLRVREKSVLKRIV